jgi:hypothetical protein
MAVGPGLMPVSWLPFPQHTQIHNWNLVFFPFYCKQGDLKKRVVFRKWSPKRGAVEGIIYYKVPVRDAMVDLNPSIYVAIIYLYGVYKNYNYVASPFKAGKYSIYLMFLIKF